MSIIKRIGNFILRVFQDITQIVWLVATAIITFTVWIIFCIGVGGFAILTRTMELFNPGICEDILEFIERLGEYFDKDDDKEVEEQED